MASRSTPSFSVSPSVIRLTPQATRQQCARRARAPSMCASSSPPASAPSTAPSAGAADAFAIDAGRDLFFPGMDAEMAISILAKPLGSLESSDDRYIAAERLKFFPSAASARALMDFVSLFSYSLPDGLPVEEWAARRKAVESLGRHAGLHLADEVATFLEAHLGDTDPHTAETAAWAISQMPSPPASALAAVEDALHRPDAPHRALLHALTAANATASVASIRTLLESDPPALGAAAQSAAAAALSVLAGDDGPISEIPNLLKVDSLNDRRAAIADLSTARYRPALEPIARAPLSIVLRAGAARSVLRGEADEEALMMLDLVLWDHPRDLDLLGRVRETKRQRDVVRNVRALYRNDALDAYVACKTLCEDAGPGGLAGDAGKQTLASHVDRPYFDYFGAYHAFKTLGWMRYAPAFDVLADAARTLPPRFFNHRVAAISALGNLGDARAKEVVGAAAGETDVLWHVRYACLLAAGVLGDGEVRERLCEDGDWLVRARARSGLGFDHLRSEF